MLTAGFAALPLAGSRLQWDEAGWSAASSVWNTALVLWIAALAHLRGAEKRRRDWSWVWIPACAAAAIVWAVPAAWEVVLVYVHPLLALVFLQRVLARKRRDWLPAFYASAAAVPVLLGVLWLRLSGAPDLPGLDGLTLRITRHAGSGMLQGVSSHFLVAAHTFLEMLHYGVWVAAIPLLAMGSAPWKLNRVPLANRAGWKRGVALFLAAGAVLVVALWACFLADYPATRDVYFTVAMLHVLAEFPFLIRSL